MASSWILLFSYQDDALSNTHQIATRRLLSKDRLLSAVCHITRLTLCVGTTRYLVAELPTNFVLGAFIYTECKRNVLELSLNHHLDLFCTMTNKCTIISQIITLLHVSKLSCHPQAACNQYLAKLHKYFKCSCW